MALITSVPYCRTADGRQITKYTLENINGARADIMDWGGVILNLWMPDRLAEFQEVTLGFHRPEDYFTNDPGFGMLVGRYANRIGDATFELDGKRYRLPANNNGNTLHGGPGNFGKQLWQSEVIGSGADSALQLKLLSPDGDQGFPGNLAVKVIYSLTNDNALAIDYFAETDQSTVVNLTNHAYFNLDGDARHIYDHEFFINATSYTPVNPKLIPTGEILQLNGSRLDLSTPDTIGARLTELPPELASFKGFDHNYILRPECAGLRIPAAAAFSDKTGILLEMLTTEPAMQFYTANFLDGQTTGKGEVHYQRHAGFCFEAQHYPDSPNRPSFPSTVLRPGETYRQTTVYRFSVR